jgi:hypothetical protein
LKANHGQQKQANTKNYLAFEEMIEELESTKQQLIERGEELKNTKKQLADKDEGLRITRQKLAYSDEQQTWTEHALEESESRVELMKYRNSVLAEDVSALKYEGVHKNSRISDLK